MFAFNFSDTQFSAPELNAPRPCAHASNCYYNGPNGCAFVHPGEEGTGMKIFHARVVKDQAGKEMWQKATVRLVGGASFYERRRLKMSWPQWCALPKNAHLPKPAKVSAPAALAPAALAPAALAPSVAPFFTQPPQKPLVTVISAPAQPLQVNFCSLGPVEQWRAMFQKGYALDTPEIIAARAAFLASFSADVRALNEKAIAEMKHQQMGNALYAIIAPFLAENESAMKEGGVWHEKMTAGKITGMLLEGFSFEELCPMLSDLDELKDKLAECCDLIKRHAEA